MDRVADYRLLARESYSAAKRLRALLEKKPDFAPARKLLDTLK